MDDDMLMISEAAKMMGVSVATIRRLNANGKLGCYRFGSRLSYRRFKKSDVERFMKDSEYVGKNS